MLLKKERKTLKEGGTHMMLKKVVALGTVAAMSISMLAGCSGGSSSSSADVKKSSDGKVQLELLSTKPENKETLQKLVDAFNGSQDKVEVQLTQPADAGTVLKTRMPKDDLPEMVAMGGDATYVELQSAGVLADISDADFLGDINESY